MAHDLMPLPYDYDALEPNIDELTMRIHHDKHHQAYVNNLNAALEKHPELFSLTLEELLSKLDQVPDDIRTAVRNHGGGTYNHNVFWQIMSPNGGGKPSGELLAAIESAFGSFEEFKDKFTKAAATQFGSGWAWMTIDNNGNLEVFSLPNQDCPISSGKNPLLTIDIWEHAYYLKYQNLRASYIEAWWNTVNWAEVSRLYKNAVK